jgi:pimeloyl-ACP methyl ester carboxylesterase
MDGLVLVSSGLIGYDWGDDTRPPQEINRIAATDGPEAARAAWLGHALFAPLAAHPPALAAFRAMVADYSGWHWQQPNRDARIAPVGPLDEIRVPTLVVSGDLDVRGYRDIARELARAIPTADLVRIPDAGHMLPLEAPETFNAVLSGFLDRCAGPNAA